MLNSPPPRGAFRPRARLTAAIGLVTLTLAGCTAPAPAPGPRERLEDELLGALQATVEEYDVPGAVAGVWTSEGAAWTAAVGTGDLAADTATSTDMSWPLRSITKSYTVTLLLQLVDEGALTLDDTIGQYVDGVTHGDRITLRQLAGMSSGNGDYTTEAFQEEFTADPTRLYTLPELNAFAIGQPAQFEPGTRHVYTNANTNLLGAVIEKVTGQSFAEVLDERIIGPLGLDDTRYVLDVGTWTEPHAQGYGPADGGREAVEQNFSIFGPAGSMISTLDDSRVWAEALATGALLDPATQAERERGAPLEVGPPYDLYALGIGSTDGWWGHNGEGLGYTAAVFHNPATQVSIVVFANESNLASGAHPADQAFRRLAEIMDAWTADG